MEERKQLIGARKSDKRIHSEWTSHMTWTFDILCKTNWRLHWRTLPVSCLISSKRFLVLHILLLTSICLYFSCMLISLSCLVFLWKVASLGCHFVTFYIWFWHLFVGSVFYYLPNWVRGGNRKCRGWIMRKSYGSTFLTPLSLVLGQSNMAASFKTKVIRFDIMFQDVD